jgi:hypothetical protein
VKTGEGPCGQDRLVYRAGGSSHTVRFASPASDLRHAGRNPPRRVDTRRMSALRANSK